MTAKYLPIFKAKLGEIKALNNAAKSHLRPMLPLFEICRIGETVRKAKRFETTKALTCDYLDEVARQIASVRNGKLTMVDAFHWQPNATTESGEQVLSYVYNRLDSLGVKVIPVIGIDRWDDPTYKIAMQNVKVSPNRYYCLRLDSHSIEDAGDAEYFEQSIVGVLNDLSIEPDRCAILMDFGDITVPSVATLIAQAEQVVQILGGMGFKFFATAGSSLPTSIDKAVKQKNSSGTVLRKEVLVWQALRAAYPNLRWLFGDYGVRGPNSADDIISPNTNGKIRHTIDKSYYIVRGHSIQEGDKGAQMYKLAENIIDSQHYLGKEFSWGDSRILACSNQEFKGNATTWIAIDTSHHLAHVVAEIEEFELSIVEETSDVNEES